MRLHVLLAVVLSIVFTSQAWAGVEQVSLEIKGLACPFCVFNIEKRIKTLEGVPEDAEFETDFDRGVVHFRWKPEVSLEPPALHEEVRRAGFTLDTIRLTFAGEAASDDEVLRVSSSANDHFIVVRAGTEEEHEAQFEALSEHIEQQPEMVRVIGAVEQDEDGEPAEDDEHEGRGWHLRLHEWMPVEPEEGDNDEDKDEA